MRSRVGWALTVVLCVSAASEAADLGKIDRTPGKEPHYQGLPKYCLLVFGPEAKTRVWLVQDGGTLYVDRNGNGDLTEPGEKVAAEKQEDADEGTYSFKVGSIRDGERLHREVTVYVARIDHMADQDDAVKTLLKKNPRARGYAVMAEIEMPGRKGTGVGGRVMQRAFYVDVNGVLQFSDRPADAPILHFGGPWQVALFGRQELRIGRDVDVVLGVGSAGVGPGSTTWIDYEGVIPTDKYPTLDVVYASRRPGDKPIREHFELKHRC
jgi:hypothetical protein